MPVKQVRVVGIPSPFRLTILGFSEFCTLLVRGWCPAPPTCLLQRDVQIIAGLLKVRF